MGTLLIVTQVKNQPTIIEDPTEMFLPRQVAILATYPRRSGE
jgi:hypothetical protein